MTASVTPHPVWGTRKPTEQEVTRRAAPILAAMIADYLAAKTADDDTTTAVEGVG